MKEGMNNKGIIFNNESDTFYLSKVDRSESI